MTGRNHRATTIVQQPSRSKKTMTLTIEHLNKAFGKQQVLRDVSLTIPQGQIVGLLGPNGAGKSTLMKIIVGLWRADNGSVQAPAHIGYLPEQNPLYEDMYVREYLLFMARTKDPNQAFPSKGKDVESIMERVGLMPEANKRIRELSKGYRQRVGLAQALMGNPELIILDEPTTGLDPNQLTEIRQVIRQCTMHNAQCTVILSTHIMQEVKAMCDRVVLLDHGQIKADKNINEVEDLETMFREFTI